MALVTTSPCTQNLSASSYPESDTLSQHIQDPTQLYANLLKFLILIDFIVLYSEPRSLGTFL